MSGFSIKDHVSRQRPGYALDRVFYRDPNIYQREVDRILLRSWLYAGHTSELPDKGDYVLLEFAGESVIVVRSNDDEIVALVNVCRHRGSRVCTDRKGHGNRLTCSYHGWTYGLDGALLAASQMPDSFDKASFGLKRLSLEIFHGMIFVNLSDQPGDFKLFHEELGPRLDPYGLAETRVAHRQTYNIKANWKLAVENYKECYHCAPAHPEYSHAHALARPEETYKEELAAVIARGVECGLSDQLFDHSYELAGDFGTDRAYERYPLLRGYVTGSEDGKPIAPLLGSISDWDGGASDFEVGPLLYALAYSDHVVLYRFLPVSLDECECDITWLVRAEAKEGEDYDIQRLTWLWDVTTQADKRIIENNHKGVMSRFYEPGPLSKMESWTNSWNRWYLNTL